MLGYSQPRLHSGCLPCRRLYWDLPFSNPQTAFPMYFFSVEVLVWEFSFENSPYTSDWEVWIDGRDRKSVKTSFPWQAVLENGTFSSAKKKTRPIPNLIKSIPVLQPLFPKCFLKIFWPKPCSLHRIFFFSLMGLHHRLYPWVMPRRGCSVGTFGSGGMLVEMYPAPMLCIP